MNEARSSESCLIAASLRFRRTAPPGAPPGPPPAPSGRARRRRRRRGRPAGPTRWRPAAGRGRPLAGAAAIIDAVRSAVPDGASALPLWCSSITSAEAKNRAGLRGEPHHQDGADGEVRHDQDAHVRMLGQPAAHLVQPVLGEPRGADHHVQVLFDTPAQVVHDHAGVGEVDHHVTPGQRVERVCPGRPRRRPRDPGRPCTARITSRPIRPRAPSTPTLAMAASA